MTPAQVAEQATRRYNAFGSSFWSTDELYQIIYEAELILATEAKVIEGVDTSISTAIGQREYSLPDNTLSVKRIEYNGYKLVPIDFRLEDTLTYNNADDTATGTPQFYSEFNGSIYLRPLPSAISTLTVYQFEEPAVLDVTSTLLSTPVRCHIHLCNYVLSIMALKDQNFAIADRFEKKWESYVQREKASTAKKKRSDSFACVKLEEDMYQSAIIAPATSTTDDILESVQVIRLLYTTTNVTTSSYVQLDDALNSDVSEIEVFDSSGRVLVLATGAAGSESPMSFYIMPGGNASRIPVSIASGARLSIKAIDGSATSGQLIINLFA